MVKTITVTEEAYKKLKRMELEKESFSNLINRIGSPKKDISLLVGIMKTKDLHEVKKRIREFKETFTQDMEKRKHVSA